MGSYSFEFLPEENLEKRIWTGNIIKSRIKPPAGDAAVLSLKSFDLDSGILN